MATIYICKCGRQVRKNTSADNTGNRDTAGCRGCPYLLPWGPTQWDATRHAMVTDVKGYECRMSPSLDYATYYQGGGEDKCVLHIYSLDYDFLDQVTAWAAKQFPDKEISCSFDRSKIRATEFIGGLYGMSVYPMQNKKGMAAKAALIERFFGPDGHRLDKTPEEEKAIVLAAIEAGKAQAQKKEDKTLMYKDPVTGWLYRVSPNPINDKGLYELEYLDQQNSTIWKPDVYWNTNAVYRDQEHLQEALDDRARRDGWELVEDVPAENPTDAAPVSPADAGAATQSQSAAEPVSLAADLPDVCQSCQCVTCGNEDCPTPCFQRDDEVQECKKLGPMGDACEYYQSKEDAQCQKEDAPSADAAATSDGSAARMCKGPDEETQTTPAAASGAALESLHAQAVLPQNEPARDIAADAPSALGFDFGADVATNAELLQCAQTFVMGRVAQVMAAKKAHDITANHYQGSWGKWCQAVGISRDTGDNLVRVAEQFGNTQINGQNLIDIQPLKLLYATSKASTPLEIREKVENLDITTYKQYQDAMSEIKARDAKIQELLEMSEGADRRADAADARAKKAEQERDAARDAQANLSAMANKFSKQRDAAEQRVEDAEHRAEEAEHRAEEAERRARAAEEDAAGWKQAGLEMQELVDQRDERIRELESGITVEAAAVDQEEIERRANELSEPLVKIIDQQNEQIERMASGNTVSAQASVLEQYLRTMQTSLLGNARRTELACYDVGALDRLAQALREFADEIDGLFEEGEENEE